MSDKAPGRVPFYARSRARRLALQAVYQWQMTGQDVADIEGQFARDDDYAKADTDYFKELLRAAVAGTADGDLEQCMDMAFEDVDPIERAILRNAGYEVLCRDDVDAAVAITEAVRLAKKYGAEQGYRFVNGVLDRLARRCRDDGPDEDALIKKYRARASAQAGARGVVVGIGDDAAVLEPPAGPLVVTTDALVAGTHFDADADARDVGYKALAVNLSDLAAMGAEPRWALSVLTLPRADEDWIVRFGEGFFGLAERHRVALVGGDTARGPLSVAVQLIGVAGAGYMSRAGARPGDGVYVTGSVGDAGLSMRRAERLHRCGAAAVAACRARQHRPVPRLEEGRHITQYASAAIDVSDGLLKDLSRLLEASGVGAEVALDRVPVSQWFRRCCLDAADWLSVLTCGEDYELLFTMDDAHLPDLGKALGECTVSRIGHVTENANLHCTWQGAPLPLPRTLGYDHFR